MVVGSAAAAGETFAMLLSVRHRLRNSAVGAYGADFRRMYCLGVHFLFSAYGKNAAGVDN